MVILTALLNEIYVAVEMMYISTDIRSMCPLLDGVLKLIEASWDGISEENLLKAEHLFFVTKEF